MRLRSVLLTGAAFAALVFTVGSAPARAAATGSDHALAVAALNDLKAAFRTVMDAENATATGPNSYIASAQRAINVLVGAASDDFDKSVDNPGDAIGAEQHVNHLLDRPDAPPFVEALHGIQVNLASAVADLQDAKKADGLDEYQAQASHALETLQIAIGRPDQYDVFGGLEGALTNTVLGVPDGAQVSDGCATPRAPGYGVYHGWLVWHAVAASHAAIQADGALLIKKEGSLIVLYTPASGMVQQHCPNKQADAAPVPGSVAARAQAILRHAARRSPLLVEVADKAGGGVSYTKAQAQAGAGVFAKNCVSCHGANLQGVAAPALAGKDFMTSAVKDNHTVQMLDYIVTQNMPFNNPGSLSATEYAQVMAYLLASNCYPASSTPFPEQPGSDYGTEKLAFQHNPSAKPNALGVCSVD